MAGRHVSENHTCVAFHKSKSVLNDTIAALSSQKREGVAIGVAHRQKSLSFLVDTCTKQENLDESACSMRKRACEAIESKLLDLYYCDYKTYAERMRGHCVALPEYFLECEKWRSVDRHPSSPAAYLSGDIDTFGLLADMTSKEISSTTAMLRNKRVSAPTPILPKTAIAPLFTTQSDFKCPACHKNNVDQKMAQTRSGDEGETIYYNCRDCGKKW